MTEELTSPSIRLEEETCPLAWLSGLAAIPWDTATTPAYFRAIVSFLHGIGFSSLTAWRETGDNGVKLWAGSHLDRCLPREGRLLPYLNQLTSDTGSEPIRLTADRPVFAAAVESWLQDRADLHVVPLADADRAAFVIVTLPAMQQQAGLALLRLLAIQSRTALAAGARSREIRDLAETLSATQARVMELAKSTLSDQTVNAVAHQLNNCLTSVLGYSQLLLEGGLHSPQENSYLRRVYSEAERMSHIVGNMLNFARRKNGGPELVDINELLHESIALQTYELEKHNVAVSLELDRDLPLTVADPYKMQIIFLNVLMNAHQSIMSSAEKGHITVRTTCVGAAPSSIRIEFEDDGPGVPDVMRDAIFRPFFTTKDSQRHAGLGLAVCRSLASEHRGHIELSCLSDRGATFSIEIPITGQ